MYFISSFEARNAFFGFEDSKRIKNFSNIFGKPGFLQPSRKRFESPKNLYWCSR